MFKKFIFLIAGFLGAFYLIYLLFTVKFYSLEQLDEARMNAVEVARQGEHDEAVERFEVLIQYDPENTLLWYDYLTVLEWAGEYERVSENIEQLALEQAPDYVLKSLVSSLHQLYKQEKTLAVARIYKKLLFSARFNHSSSAPYLYRVLSDEDKTLARSFKQHAEKEYPNAQWIVARSAQGVKTPEPRTESTQTRYAPLALAKRPAYVVSGAMTKAEYEQWVRLVNRIFPDSERKISFLEKQVKKYPNEKYILQDYITLLSWQGYHKKALDVYDENKHIEFDAYLHEALSYSALMLKKREQAVAHLKTGEIISHENSTDTTILLARKHINAKNYEQSIELLNKSLEKSPKDIELLETLAYTYNQDNQYDFQKLSTYDRILALQPERKEIEKNRLLTLAELNILDEPLAKLEQDPSYFTPDETIRIYNLSSGAWARKVSNIESLSVAHPVAKKALELNQRYVESLRSFKPEGFERDVLYAHSDRLVILNKCQEHQKVVQQYTEFADSYENYPVFAIESIVDSLQSVYQSHKALEVAEYGLSQQPENYNLLRLAFYASLDSDDHEKAQNYLKTLERNQPVWLQSDETGKVEDNPRRASIELLQEMYLAYNDKLSEAQEGVEALVAKSSGSNAFRTNLATIYRWRGWYAESEKMLRSVLSTDEGYLPSQIGLTYLELDQQKYQDAHLRAEKLFEEKPYDPAVMLLKEDLDLHNDNIFTLSTGTNNSSGSDFSSKDKSYDMRLYSQPLNYDWRVFAHHARSNARYFDRDDSIVHTGVGLEYRRPWGTLSTEIFDVRDEDSTEWRLDGEFIQDDFWRHGFSYQSFSDATPIRAFVTDVDVNAFNVFTSYRPHERQSYGASLTFSDFSDNNKRTQLSLSGAQTLSNGEDGRWTVYESIYLETNSEDDNRFYYNPERAIGVFVAGEYEDFIWKEAIKHFKHNLYFGIGTSLQKDFDGGLTWEVKYQHKWRLSKRFSFFYGLGYGDKYYDGQKESGTSGFAGLEVIF